MSHRGRDFRKIVKNKEAIFGFNRLAIENINKNVQPLKKTINYLYLTERYTTIKNL